MQIRLDSLDDPRVHALLRHHLDEIAPTAPEASRHALDLSGLKAPNISFWCVWDDVHSVSVGEPGSALPKEVLAGFGALKTHSPDHGEIKSMRTAPTHLRQGVASQLLTHILSEARERGLKWVSLETGSMDYFASARALYVRHGFTLSAPFGEYQPDPNSVFMIKQLK